MDANHHQLERRKKFIADNLVDVFDSFMSIVGNGTHSSLPLKNGSSNNNNDALSFIDWLSSANLSEDDFLAFALSLVDSGRYVLFINLLKWDLINCGRLEELYKRTSLIGTSRPKINSNLSIKQEELLKLTPTHRSFLLRHTDTIECLLSCDQLDSLLNYLQCVGAINASQCIFIKAETSSKRVRLLMEYLTDGDAFDEVCDHLCYALLVEGHYRLFSILHEAANPQRLEAIAKSHLCEHPLTQEEEDQENNNTVLEPSGILQDLTVDVPDTNTASQLPYYSTATRQDIYRNFSRPKGLALIINNYRFHSTSLLRDRDGTEVDRKNMTNLLNQLGYQLLPVQMDLTAAEMMNSIYKFAQRPEHSQMDSCVVVVLTHGEYDHFTGVDGQKCSLHKFIAHLNARNCSALAGKPKIFIVQACRGDLHDIGVERYIQPGAEEEVAVDGRGGGGGDKGDQPLSPQRVTASFPSRVLSCIGVGSVGRERGIGVAITTQHQQPQKQFIPPPTMISLQQKRNKPSGPSSSNESPQNRGLYRVVKDPTDADMLIAYATTPNHVSWRNSMNGTWFIQSICEVFGRSAATEDIVTMLTKVNKQVAHVYQSSNSGAKQIPEMASRLRKRFYFFPGIDRE